MADLDYEWQPVQRAAVQESASQLSVDAWSRHHAQPMSVTWGQDFHISLQPSIQEMMQAVDLQDVPAEAQSNPVTRPQIDANDFFICQFRNQRFNPHGPASSEDCGPTSLAMIARYYGAAFTDNGTNELVDSGTDDPAKLVSSVRFLMTGGRNSNEGTSLSQVKRGAEKIGLNTEAVQNMNDLDTALDAGHMVVLAGNPRDYEKQLGLHYGKGGTVYDGGHFITIVSHTDDTYIVNDPANGGGSMSLTRAQLEKYISYDGSGDKGVAVFN